ncbi:cathepsin A [Acrasis kona]|uniref:Carboxypeptidase n=1 Tax=Acrasis kona TaxID=1008807 RepID=A0AAW2ZS35_9EUKA
MLKLIAVILSLTFVIAQNPDVISNLPGLQSKINFKQYSGYIPSSASGERNLFYWFVESQSNPSTDPVVLWMNGGPGCSSLDGLLTEHGPFLVNGDGRTLRQNSNSWNRVANMLYLEAPAGVGYSYTKSKDTVYNDNEMANDVYAFLLNFFKKYPQFVKNPFFVSGESYAGHYVPVCTSRILEGIKLGRDVPINLQGFLVGNGVTDQESDQNSVPTYIYHHALTSQDEYDNAVNKCHGDFYRNAADKDCEEALADLRKAAGKVNVYDIYSPCIDTGNNQNQIVTGSSILTPWLRNPGANLNPPCVNGSSVISYLNRGDVKQALHAHLEIRWEICNDFIITVYDWTYQTMLPFYEKILGAGIRGLVYSGDADMAVNQLGTQTAINKLQKNVGAKSTRSWSSWSVSGSPQVAGYIKQWNNNLTYLTIKGAGHMVPSSKPEESLYFFTKFIRNEKI